MSDPVSDLQAAFADESKWEIRRGVPVFCAHIRKDPSGNTLYEVDSDRLKRIADQINRREKEDGIVPLILDGHSKQGQPAGAQPDLLGFSRNATIITYGDDKKVALAWDRYFKKDKFEKSKQFPRNSVEYCPEDDTIHAEALLKTVPVLDLPMQIHYEGGKKVYAYSMDEELYELTDEHKGRAMAYLEHCCKTHPLMKHLTQMYGAACGSQHYSKEVNPMAEPTPAAPVVPVPVAKTPEIVQYEKSIDDLKGLVKAQDDAIARLTKENRLVRYEKDLTELHGKKIIADVAAELKDCEDLTPEQFKRHTERIVSAHARLKADYEKSVLSGGFVKVSTDPAEGGPSPDLKTKVDHEKAMVILRNNPGMQYDKAVEASAKA